ncbi:MAG TPA: ABC transporter ATP-binding protein [Methylomirabilota bacterium]|nr:ABC transporter ATP-binding protein [Methylomirabilota bacterium]
MGVVCLGTGTVLSLAVPRTVQRAVEALETDAAGAPVGSYVTLILALAVASGLARLGSRFSIIGAAQRVEYDVRNDLYASLLRYPPAFYATSSIGDLMSRSTSDVSAVRSLVGFGVVSFISTAFAFVGAVGAMLTVDPRLTVWALAPLSVLVVVARRANATVHERTRAAQDQLGVLSSRVQEHLSGIAVVRAYTLEPRAEEEFDRANADYLTKSLALQRTLSQFAPLSGLITGLGALIVLWLGGREVIAGRLTLGALVAFNGYLAYLAWPTLALGYTLSMVRRGATSMERIREVVAAAPPPDPPGLALASPPAVSFQHLTFAYPGRPAALTDVSFAVAPGEMVAVVGPTGGGKSTLGLLVARLWDAPPGTVLVDGREVSAWSRPALRGGLGYVPQEAFLFSRSIADNVTLRREDVTPDAARAAAAVAGVADEVERLPSGWDTVVGERGLTVSGGQRQRLALARALAGRPRLLVLDDVFASVDAVKEEEIIVALRAATAGLTVLLMTHRLRAARAADRIVVLAEGRVVETGTHDTLLTQGGAYAQLWRLQQLEEEIARA